MATSYSTLLGLALPVQGELSGTWGDTVNNYITTYLDAAVAGTQTLSTDADVTLTKTTGTALGATSSQYAILNCTGARTAQRTITAPAASKAYLITNATTGGFAVKLVGAGPTTGITIANGEKCLVAWNGSDFIKIALLDGAGTFTTLTVSGGIQNTPIGSTTPSTGAFTTLSGTVATITGGADVQTSVTIAESGTRSLVLKNPTTTLDAVVGTGTNHPLTIEAQSTVTTKIGAAGSRSAVTTVSSTGLAVTGALSATGDATVGAAAAATNRILNINGVVNKASRIAFQESGVDRWLIGNGAASENGNFEIYDATSGNNFVMTRTGNLGLGVTPSAWDSPYKAFQISSQSSLASYPGNYTWLNTNVVVSSGANRYIANGYATQYEQASGAHAWYTAPSGTAGNAITFTQAMTLDASGYLYVNSGRVYFNSGGTASISNAPDANWGYLYKPSQDGAVGAHGWLNTAGTTAAYLTGTGNFVATGNVTAYSDERLKANWQDFDADILGQLAKVKVGVYDRTDIEATQVGVSAQSLQAVLPNAVNTGEDGMLSVAYGNAALSMCVMLARKVEELEARLAKLEG